MKNCLFLILVSILSAGNALADNSKFFGTFAFSFEACGDAQSMNLVIGNDDARKGADNYFYAPLDGSSHSFSGIDGDGDPYQVTVRISGNTYYYHKIGQWQSEPEKGWTDELTLTFSSDFNTFSLSGELTDDDPAYCTGSMTGSGMRIMNRPDTPSLSSPANGSTGVSLTPTLTAGAFSDPDSGDTHSKTDWHISISNNFSTGILAESSTTNLLSLTVPFSVLESNTTYYWRVRFYDNRNTVSDWSDTFSFTTEAAFTDTNRNGIPDDLENKTADLNNDGTADIEQTDYIKTLNTVVGGGQMGLSIKESETVTQIVEINAMDPDSISQIVRPHTMPLGLLTFRLNVANPGDTAHVKVYFSEPAPENASWFIYNSADGWIDYSEYALFSPDRRSVEVEITDGGLGDADGTSNGVIADPCGFGIASWLRGKVTDAGDSSGLSLVDITLPGIDLNLKTLSDGSYITMLLPGIYDLDFAASGYQSFSMESLPIPEAKMVVQDVALTGRCKVTGMGIAGTPSDGSSIKMSVFAESGSESIVYRYSIHNGYGTTNYDGNSWYSMTDSEYITDNSCGYSFSTQDKSIVVVWATSSGINNVDPTGIPIIGWSVDTGSTVCKTHFTGVTITGDQKVNEMITFAVNAVNVCSDTKYYRFSMHPYYGTVDYDGSHWESMTTGEWTSSNSINYTFTQPGKYIVVVWVTDDVENVNPNGIPIIGWSVDIE